MSTSGAATAPRCLSRKARLVPSADASAVATPAARVMDSPSTSGRSPRHHEASLPRSTNFRPSCRATPLALSLTAKMSAGPPSRADALEAAAEAVRDARSTDRDAILEAQSVLRHAEKGHDRAVHDAEKRLHAEDTDAAQEALAAAHADRHGVAEARPLLDRDRRPHARRRGGARHGGRHIRGPRRRAGRHQPARALRRSSPHARSPLRGDRSRQDFADGASEPGSRSSPAAPRT